MQKMQVVFVATENIDNDLILGPAHDVIVLPAFREMDLGSVKFSALCVGFDNAD